MILQEIWDNFRNHAGPCHDCPHWANRGCSKPLYGVYNNDSYQADVLFVGIEPGGAGEPSYPEMMGESVETKLELMKEEFPENFADVQQRFKDLGMYTVPYSPHMKNCVDTFESQGIMNYSYTNIKKCPQDDEGSGLDAAISECSKYFPAELEYVDPDVLILFGRRTMDAIYGLLDVHEHNNVSSSIRRESLRVRTVPGLTIIPSIHFSSNRNRGFPRNLPEVSDMLYGDPDAFTEEDYWNRMAELTSEALD